MPHGSGARLGALPESATRDHRNTDLPNRIIGLQDGSLGTGTQSLLPIVLHRDGNSDATHSESANQASVNNRRRFVASASKEAPISSPRKSSGSGFSQLSAKRYCPEP